ncbi:GMC oxidoreductase-domain-containing protein [Abortiporus biennis]|nr:GMC oxidoreductase-domain-containing protein [Abortiporus biennis]
MSEYDIIFAGGGTTACIVAGRLAAADPSLKILVVEAGPHTQNVLFHTQPARYLNHLLPDSRTIKFLVGKESEHLGGRAPIVPCGQCIGGGSSVNFTMYTRPSASDFDDWVKDFSNAGWGSKDLLPLFKKFETYQAGEGLGTHGYSGPLKVSYGGIFTNVGQNFLEMTSKYDPKRKTTVDANGFYSCDEYARWPKWISKDTGTRSDTAHHYLYNQTSKNLQVLTDVLVKRVIFEDTRAVGIEYIQNPRFHPEASTEVSIAKANRMVVLCAGSLGSPLILERSGVGSKDRLGKLGIPTVVDLPGVGEGYQDHQVYFPPFKASKDSSTLDGILRNDTKVVDECTTQWLDNGKGLMAHNGLDAGIKIRPSQEDLNAIGRVFQERWNAHYTNSPDKAVAWIGFAALFVGDHDNIPDEKYFSATCFLTYPSSQGYIHITSGSDVQAAPEFDPAFLKEKDDLALLVWTYKRSREYARRMACYRGEYTPDHPVFPKGSPASCVGDAQGPVSIDAPDIAYSTEDDAAIENYIRAKIATAWHGLGTCSMKPRDVGGVVDSQLNVYGVSGLKVADMSIAPGNVGSNTYSTAALIGEKAALIIGEELGLKNV